MRTLINWIFSNAESRALGSGEGNIWYGEILLALDALQEKYRGNNKEAEIVRKRKGEIYRYIVMGWLNWSMFLKCLEKLSHYINLFLAFQEVAEEPEHLSAVPDAEEITEESVTKLEQVQKYEKTVSNLYNKGEDMKTIQEYKNVTVELLLGKKAEAIASEFSCK